jgi:hypothetical protein
MNLSRGRPRAEYAVDLRINGEAALTRQPPFAFWPLTLSTAILYHV